MNLSSLETWRVLAIDPTSKGFGFAVLEGRGSLLDWGVRHARGEMNLKCVKRASELIARYDPDVLVVEDPEARGSRRCVRVRDLIADFRVLALTRSVRFRSISQRKAKKLFAAKGAANKRQVAVTIARQFPELDLHLPPIRKPWMSEDERMAIFDAAALALTFLDRLEKRSPATRIQSTLQAYA